MHSPNARVLLIFGVMTCGVALVVACGSDDTGAPAEPQRDAGTTTPPGNPTEMWDAGAHTSADSGSSDAAATDAGDAGQKANGATCASGPECASGHCYVGGTGGGGGGGGGASEGFCTITCANPGGDNDPTCLAQPNAFTGKCNGKGFCQQRK